MRARDPSKGDPSKGDPSKGRRLPAGVSELVELVVAYAKQETVEPVRRQVKALGRGVAGGALLALGTVLLAVGFLRALQVELGGAGRPAINPYGTVGHLSGDLSWVPYVGAAVFCLLVSVGCVLMVLRQGRQ
jgi:hypothetical protein